jgi:cysteine-rich repeat protein
VFVSFIRMKGSSGSPSGQRNLPKMSFGDQRPIDWSPDGEGRYVSEFMHQNRRICCRARLPRCACRYDLGGLRWFGFTPDRRRRWGSGDTDPIVVDPNAVCGDGVEAPSEQRDDGNTTSGGGCDEQCRWQQILK